MHASAHLLASQVKRSNTIKLQKSLLWPGCEVAEMRVALIRTESLLKFPEVSNYEIFQAANHSFSNLSFMMANDAQTFINPFLFP